MSVYWRPFYRPTYDRVRVSNISSTNVQENNPVQANEQSASASSRGRGHYRWGYPWWGFRRSPAVANNSADQTHTTRQNGSANNNINIHSPATFSNIRVNKVAATNAQSNGAVQSSSQRAWSTGRAVNGAWQTSNNYQNGSANNNINIHA